MTAVRGLRSLTGSRELILLLAVAALSSGTFIDLGLLTPLTLALVVAALALTLVAPFAGPASSASGTAWMAVVALLGAVGTLYGLVSGLELAFMLVLCVGATSLVALRSTEGRMVIAGVTVIALIAAIVSVWHWGSAPIDVFDSLQKGSAALLAGRNPYGITFLATDVVGPGSDILVPVHFQYLPGAAILAAPGRLVGDVRLMSLVASAVLVVFCVALAYESPERAARAWKVAALSVIIPLTLVMVHFSWVDVYCMAGFAGWVTLRRRHPRFGIAALAIALTVKPTILVAVVPLLIWSRRARREAIIAVCAAAVVILPFALATGIGAFYRDVIGVQTQFGFWYGSLTVGSAWYALTGHVLAPWVGPVFGFGIAAGVLWRRPRDLSDVLIQGAALSTAAFLLSKWAFVNYYYTPVWLLVLAVAGRGIRFEAETADVRLPLPVWRRQGSHARPALEAPHPVWLAGAMRAACSVLAFRDVNGRRLRGG